MKKTYLIVAIALVCFAVIQTAQAIETNCEKYGYILAGDYDIQNNIWGADTAQCITYTGGTSWYVSLSAHNQGTVASYPSIFKGCHWGTCTPSSGMPLTVAQCSSAPFNYSVSSTRPTGVYNVAAEAWLSPITDTIDGYDGGAEVMIVLDYHGQFYPGGRKVGNFNGYDVYLKKLPTWTFVIYVLSGRSSASGDMMDFIMDAVKRGYVKTSWYLHVMEAGFEIMKDGQGLSCNSFSFAVTPGTYTAPPIPAPGTTVPAAPSDLVLTALSPSIMSISWKDNSANEAGFYVYEKRGTGTPTTLIHTTGPNITLANSTGLGANTTYSYRVCAFNANGISAYTPVVSAKTKATW